MNVIILEDEPRAASHLERLLNNIDPNITVVARLESVREGIQFLKSKTEPDLIFSDIQLADGLSFEIYNQVPVRCPIIFTTAYDQYAIEAFRTNGIDYLLKPIEESRLRQAIEKALHFTPGLVLDKLLSISNGLNQKTYKSRFLVKVGDKIKSIPVEEIRAFYSQEKATYILAGNSRSFAVDYSLDQLEAMLDPGKYFRINRKYIVSVDVCTNIVAWTNSRLRLKIEGIDDPGIIVARERVQDFKDWLDR